MSHIFISYKSQERHYALAVHDKLLSWGYEPWLDVKRLKVGGDWAKSIDEAVKSSAAVLGIMTPMALNSIMVTNEWRLAIARNIPFLPLLHEGNNEHYLFYHLQFIDFCADDKTAAFAMLKTTLAEKIAQHRPAPDKTQSYLQSLYDHVTSVLQQKIIKRADDDPYKPIDLTMATSENAVDSPKAPDDDADMFSASYAALGVNVVAKKETPTEFTHFNEALAAYEGRLLLLGEPGAGKTITLLNAVRDAVVLRTLDERHPLPLYGVIATWKSEYQKRQSLAEWLAAGYKKYFSQQEIATILNEGSAFLLLDGLDELGSERLKNPEKPEEGSYDPRPLFMQQLPENNRILITCRKQEYESLGEKIKLNGAVTLQPLADVQLWDYLREMPELRDIIRADDALKKMAQTPLLLSFIAFAFRDAPEDLKQRGDLSETQLRNFIFDRYVDENYQHYIRRERKTPEFTLQEIKDVLGHVAMINASGENRRKDNVLNIDDFEEAFEILNLISGRTNVFIQLSQTLNLITTDADNNHRFIHLLLRDYFAYQYSLPRLEDERFYTKWYAPSPAKALGTVVKRDAEAAKKLIELLNNWQKKSVMRASAAAALGNIGSQQAVQPLISVLTNRDDDSEVRRAATEALGTIGSEQAMKVLITILNNLKDNSWVRSSAALALGKIGGEQAVQALHLGMFLQSNDYVVRLSAKEGLDNIGGWRAVQAYSEVLANPYDYTEIRAIAAESLGDIGDEQAVRMLIKVLAYPTEIYVRNKRICDIAAEVLEKIGTPEALEAVRQWQEEQEKQ